MKMNLKKSWLESNVTKFIKNNKLLLLVALFFVVWKFFLIYTMWHGRTIAPEPDDSFIYIAHLNSVIKCPSFLFCNGPYSLHNFGGWEHLSYRLFFGSIGKLFHWTGSQTYHYSFYIGIILLLPTLIYFIKKLTKNNQSLSALILFFLALYHGAGSYHGFFWIVPSFFSVLLFFLMFGIILDNKNKYWKYTLPIIALTASLNHMLSIYASVIFLFYFILNTWHFKKINKKLFKKILLIGIFSIIPYFITSFIIQNDAYSITNLSHSTVAKSTTLANLSHSTVAKSTTLTNLSPSLKQFTPHSPIHFLPVLTNKISGLLNFPGFYPIKIDYLNWLFPNILGIIAFIVIITLILYNKNYKILHLYLATVLFVIISAKSIYGIRALVYLWPITFILYAYGTYYFWQFIQNNIPQKIFKKILSYSFIFILVLFIILNLTYSYLSNLENNRNNRYNLPTKFNDFLATNKLKTYCSTSILGMNPLYNNGIIQSNFCNKKSSNKKYLATLYKKHKVSLLQIIIAKAKNRPLPKTEKAKFDAIPENFKFYKQFGDILIYKRK